MSAMTAEHRPAKGELHYLNHLLDQMALADISGYHPMGRKGVAALDGDIARNMRVTR